MPKGEDITTRFKVDISDLKKGITEANNQIKLANSEFKKASAGMDDWTKSSEGISSKLEQLKSILDAQTKKLESYQKQLQNAKKYEKEAADEVTKLKSALEKAKAEYGENSDEVKKLEKELNSAEKAESSLKSEVEKLTITCNNQEAAVKDTAAQMNNLESELKDVEEAERLTAKNGKTLEENLANVKKKSEDAGNGFTVMKGALANLVADGFRMAINAMKDFVTETIEVGRTFDSSMSQVAAVSGATGDELESLRNKAKEMGASTKFTASEAADAFNYMAMAGWKTEDMLAGIDGILNLAAASGTDLATTSDIVTDALTAMGYSAADSGRLADVMAAASSNANTNVEMMGATFKYAAPIVGALGYSMEDTAVAIGLMANSGIKGEQAGTALRSMLSRLAAPPKEAATAMDALGISITNADGTMKPFSQIMSELQDKFAGLSETQQTQYAKQLAGTEAMSGFLAIVNAAPADVDKLTAAVNNSSGAAEEMAAIMLDNLGGDLTILKSKLEGVQLAIYEKFEPAMRKGVEVLSKLLDAVNFVVEHSTAFITGLKAMGAAIAAYVAYTTAIKVMKDGWMALEIVQKAVTAAQWLMNAAMSANPIGIIIALVAALVAGFIALWNNSEEFRNFWIGLWEKIKEVCSVAIEGIKNFFTGLGEKFTELKDTVKEKWNSMKDTIANSKLAEAAGTVFNALKKTVSDKMSNIKTAYEEAGGGIKGVAAGMWEGIKGYYTAGYDFINNLTGGKLTELKGKFKEKVTEIKDNFVNGFKNMIDKVVEFFNNLPYNIGYALGFVLGKIVQFGKDLYTFATTTIPEFIDKVIEFFKTLPERVWEWLVNTYNNIVTWGTNIINKAVETGTNFVESLINFFATLPSRIWEWLVNTYNKAVTFGSNMISKAKEVGKNFVNNVITFIKELPGKIATWFTNTITKAKTFATDLGAKGKEAANNLKDGIINIVKTIPEKMKSIGKNIVDGVWNGIKNAKDQFMANVKSFFSGIVDGAKAALGIESPSRVFAKEVGKFIPSGVAVGINDNVKPLMNSIRNMSDKAVELSQNMLSKIQVPELNNGSTGIPAVAGATSNVTSFTQIINAPTSPSRLELYRQTKNLLALTGGAN